MRLLELRPSGDVPLHLQPHGEEAHHDANEVSEAPESNPSVSYEHQMTKLPKTIEVICHPAFRHDRAAIVVTARTVVDAADGCNTVCTVTLPWIPDSFNEFFLLWNI